MEFSSSLSPQDTGQYHCVVRILNAETNELVIDGSGYEIIEVPEPPINNILPVTIGSSVGVVLVICVCILIGIIVVISVQIVYHRKRATQNRHANRRSKMCSICVDLYD